jgi:aminoglycoside phosphotransferase (APT) family kinase protein
VPLPAHPHFHSPKGWALDFLEQIQGLVACAGETCSVNLDKLRHCISQATAAILAAPPSVLLHNDIQWSNIIVNGGALVGLIDYDDVEAGPAEIDAWYVVHAIVNAENPALPCPALDRRCLRSAWKSVARWWPEAFSAPGLRDRYIAWYVGEILCNLAQPSVWQTQAEATEEAKLIYQAVFEEPGFADWIS